MQIFVGGSIFKKVQNISINLFDGSDAENIFRIPTIVKKLEVD